MRNSLFVSIFFFITFCRSPVDKTKICDQKSIGYKLELARRVFTKDTSAYCYFAAQIPLISGTLSSDFVSEKTLAPILIAKDRVLNFTNTESMSTSCEVKLNATVIKPTVTLSADQKTFSLTPPSSGWTLDVENIVTMQFQNCKTAAGADVVIPGTGIPLYIAEKVIYVDSASGSDSNAGTTTAPMKSILAALTSASSGCTDRCAIGVKGGNYPINGSITMPTNTSIFGGFDPTDWKIRRADKTLLSPYDTILSDTATNVAATLSTDPYSTLKYVNYSGLKSKSILDGIVVNGPVSATATSFLGVIGSVGMQSGAGFIIRNLIANDVCTSVNNNTSAALYSGTNSGTIQIVNSKLSGSSIVAATSSRSGIVYFTSSATSSISVSDSELISGKADGNGATGFLMNGINDGTISLSKNIITANDCTNCNSVGILATFSTPSGMKLSENTVSAGTGAFSIGISLATAGTGILVDKNIITIGAGTNGSGGILTGTGISLPVISNNTISGGSCSAASCVTAGIIISQPMNTSITDNKLSPGVCTGTPCFTAGLHFNSVGTHTITGNTINSTGSCSTNGCTSAGIYNINTTGANTFTISNNTITSGSCSGTSCTCAGIGNNLPASSSGIHNWILNTNNISSGTCSGGGCNVAGFFTNDQHANGSDFSFNNNTLTSGNCTGTPCKTFGFSSTAIPNRTASVSFIGNTISAGNTLSGAGTESTGFNLTYNNATVFMNNNTITSGTANTTWGANIAFLVGMTFTNNTVSVGSAAGTQIGYRQANATLTMTGNTISSGFPSVTTTARTAFALDNYGGTPSIQRNTFKNESGVGAPTAVNIVGNTNPLQFCSNVLIGGSGTDPTSLATLRLGLLNSSPPGARFIGNTIIGPNNTGAGTSNPVLFTTTGAHTNLKLDQNLFVGNSPATNCVNEAVAGISYATLVKNNFSSCTNTFYRRFGMANFDTFCTGNFGQAGCGMLLMGISSINNEVQTPTFTNFGTGDFHLIAPTSTLVLNGLTEGLSPNDHVTKFTTACGNALDRDGATRTNGTALGAYK
jgi:hypothetical protein